MNSVRPVQLGGPVESIKLDDVQRSVHTSFSHQFSQPGKTIDIYLARDILWKFRTPFDLASERNTLDTRTVGQGGESSTVLGPAVAPVMNRDVANEGTVSRSDASEKIMQHLGIENVDMLPVEQRRGFDVDLTVDSQNGRTQRESFCSLPRICEAVGIAMPMAPFEDAAAVDYTAVVFSLDDQLEAIGINETVLVNQNANFGGQFQEWKDFLLILVLGRGWLDFLVLLCVHESVAWSRKDAVIYSSLRTLAFLLSCASLPSPFLWSL